MANATREAVSAAAYTAISNLQTVSGVHRRSVRQPLRLDLATVQPTGTAVDWRQSPDA